MKTLKKKKFLQNLFYDLMILSLSLSKLQQKKYERFLSHQQQRALEQRLTLCSLLKKNFRAGAKQIAMISHLPLHIVEQIV